MQYAFDLVACTQLFKSLCMSVGPLVGPTRSVKSNHEVIKSTLLTLPTLMRPCLVVSLGLVQVLGLVLGLGVRWGLRLE